jgi:hypothetical protein
MYTSYGLIASEIHAVVVLLHVVLTDVMSSPEVDGSWLSGLTADLKHDRVKSFVTCSPIHYEADHAQH